jgi:peptidoglycan/LPS O-acetylase OafA/YrhL
MGVQSHQFATLDGMRGLAALAVLSVHVASLSPGTGGIVLAHSYLAVDFFFCLSGFVLAHAYERKLQAGLSTGEFMRIRLLRLYPLYLVGTLLGIAIVAGDLEWSKPKTAIRVATALAFLPSPYPHGVAYIWNLPAWSLFFELVANAVYAAAIHRLSNRRLFVIAVASLIAAALCYHSLHTGSMWDRFAFAFPRVGVSFFAGVLTYRLWRTSSWRPSLPPVALCLLLVLMLAVGTAPPWGERYDFLAVTLFPLLIYCAACCEPGPRLRPIFLWLGATSYALYITHWPALQVIGWAGAIALAAILSAVDPLFRAALRKPKAVPQSV